MRLAVVLAVRLLAGCVVGSFAGVPVVVVRRGGGMCAPGLGR
jgi:hypothetical protein